MIESLRKIYGIAYLSSRWIIRQPVWLIQSTLSLIGFAVLLYAWGGLEGLKHIIIAWIIGGLWGTGVNIVGQEVGWHRMMYLHDMFIASPVKPVHYLIGVFTMSLIFPIIELLVMMPLAYMLNAWNILFISLLMGLPVLLASIMLGLIIVMRIEKPINISAITNPISWLLVILPPVYYPAWILPEQARIIALTIPTSAAAEIARQLTGLGTSINILYPTIIVTTWVIAGIILASKTIKWGLN